LKCVKLIPAAAVMSVNFTVGIATGLITALAGALSCVTFGARFGLVRRA
jgi:hypothetical protein